MRATICFAAEDELGFTSFMHTPQVAILFGLRKDEVFHVRVRDLKDGEVSKYWAWWDAEKENFVPGMIWPHPDLVEMCFPCGTAHLVEEGKGEKINVFVERCSETQP